MSLSPQQLYDRSLGLTSTDMAAVLRVHPYRTPLHVFLEKIGAAPPFVENVSTKWGEKLEPLIRSDYEERFDVVVEIQGTHRHPKIPWWMATPDGLVFRRGARVAERGLEIKVHDRDAQWFGGLVYGPPGSDEVPPHELIQCAAGMGATGLQMWDLVAFLGGRPVDYTIVRDEDLLEMMREEGERFFVDHVKARVEPPHDGSAAWDAYLKRKWKKNTDELVRIDNNPDVLALIAELRSARGDEADAQARKTRVQQRIKNLIADRAGFVWFDEETNKDAKVTWKRNKDGLREDHKATIIELKNRAGLFASANADIAMTAADAMRDLEDDKIAGVPARDIARFIDEVFAVVREISQMPTITKVVQGARPFNVPRFWKSRRDEDKDDEDAAIGGAVTPTEEN